MYSGHASFQRSDVVIGPIGRREVRLEIERGELGRQGDVL